MFGRRYIQNACRPEGIGGSILLSRMNIGHHAALAAWGLGFLPAAEGEVLDAGCGGGANVKRLLSLFPGSRVTGLDYSPVGVAKTARLNRKAIRAGRCGAVCGDAAAMPFADGRFSAVTAFETVYFWQPVRRAFAEVFRVLAPGGCFLVCNETDVPGAGRSSLIEGMTVYTAGELRALLEEAGFSAAEEHRAEGKGWVCLTARKEKQR